MVKGAIRGQRLKARIRAERPARLLDSLRATMKYQMNLEEVAHRAKVSTATVSRVLNNKQVVRGSTRDRVIKAIADLNYHPNLHARSLAAGTSHTFGIIVSNLENPFFYDIVNKVEAEAHNHGYEVVVANTDYRPDQLLKSIRLMTGRRVAGLAVLVSEIQPDIIEELRGARFPVVFYDVSTAHKNLTNVRLNYRKGMEKLASYLHMLGHTKRIAWLGHHVEFSPLSDRRDALIDAFRRLAPEAEVKTFTGRDTLEGGWQTTREMLSSAFKPTAVVCANDFMAIGVLRALREEDIAVPQEMSVTGLDNIKFSQFCNPTLTTVHVPRDRIGHIVFEKLFRSSEIPLAHGSEFVIDPDLVIRESTGPAGI
jgi:DNA-binding LacI/PurR family transcriptional regulator